MSKVYILPQKCCNYPKLTIKYLTTRACFYMCRGDFACIYDCYNIIFGFRRGELFQAKAIMQVFKDHFVRHREQEVGNWMTAIENATMTCIGCEMKFL
jgi:hypothetical protein